MICVIEFRIVSYRYSCEKQTGKDVGGFSTTWWWSSCCEGWTRRGNIHRYEFFFKIIIVSVMNQTHSICLRLIVDKLYQFTLLVKWKIRPIESINSYSWVLYSVSEDFFQNYCTNITFFPWRYRELVMVYTYLSYYCSILHLVPTLSLVCPD